MLRARIFFLALVIALVAGGRALGASDDHPAQPDDRSAQSPDDRSAQSPDDTSAQSIDQAAIDAYRRGDLDSARSLWISELDLGRDTGTDAPEGTGPGSSRALSSAERARVLYNLGNVAFRQKRNLEAVGWYSAALRLAPRDPDIWWNLEHARGEAKLEPADRGDLSATLRRLVSSLTLAESEWLVLGCLALWAAALAFEALRGGLTARRLALGGAVLVLAALGPWIFSLERSSRHPLLAIQEGQLDVHSEPRASAPVIAQVAAGDELEARDALPEWMKVEVGNGVEGWARKSSLFALNR
jgi:tetratricopeptide (TPR) repeat protein